MAKELNDFLIEQTKKKVKPVPKTELDKLNSSLESHKLKSVEMNPYDWHKGMFERHKKLAQRHSLDGHEHLSDLHFEKSRKHYGLAQTYL